MMSQPYAPGVFFENSEFLVMCNRLAAVPFCLAMLLTSGGKLMPEAPLYKVAMVSFTNVYASTCQYEALKYVSFPVQMLGKSFKMTPVMLWGMAISGKQYRATDWVVALAVTLGVTEFLLSGPIDSAATQGTSIKGLLLILVFLALDGFTSTKQEQLFKDYNTSKYNLMLYVNLGSCVLSSFTLTLTGGLQDSVAFIAKYPNFLYDCGTLSVSAVTAQWFIYSQVESFGALVFAATMNVRQVVSIIYSYLQYDHMITSLQVIGLLIVFGALFYKSYDGFSAKASPGEKEALAKEKAQIKGKESA